MVSPGRDHDHERFHRSSNITTTEHHYCYRPSTYIPPFRYNYFRIFLLIGTLFRTRRGADCVQGVLRRYSSTQFSKEEQSDSRPFITTSGSSISCFCRFQYPTNSDCAFVRSKTGTTYKIPPSLKYKHDSYPNRTPTDAAWSAYCTEIHAESRAKFTFHFTRIACPSTNLTSRHKISSRIVIDRSNIVGQGFTTSHGGPRLSLTASCSICGALVVFTDENIASG